MFTRLLALLAAIAVPSVAAQGQPSGLAKATFAAGCGRYARLDGLWGKLRK